MNQPKRLLSSLSGRESFTDYLVIMDRLDPNNLLQVMIKYRLKIQKCRPIKIHEWSSLANT